MALRRPILPSRLTGAPAPDAAVVAPVVPSAPVSAPVVKDKPIPEVSPAPASATPARNALAGAASSAFGTLPVAGAAESVAEPASLAPVEPAAPAPVEVVPQAGPESVPAPAAAELAAEMFAVKRAAPVEAAASAPQADEPAAEPEAEAAPQGPTTFLDENAFEVSRPESSRLKRRVREKRARDFGAATQVTAADKVADTKPRVAFASNVPVDTRPLDKVDEELIASGIVAPPPVDSLTTAVPMGLAVEERTWDIAPPPEPLPPVVAPVAPVDVPAPAPVQSVASQPEPAPAPATPAPAFSLARGAEPMAPVAPSAPEPAAPAWSVPASGNEWDIPAPAALPAEEAWQHEGAPLGPDGRPAPGQLPPPADVYKPVLGGAEPQLSPPWAMGAQGSASYPPPELPVGASKPIPAKSGGAFSWGMALAALAVVGVVALVYMRPSSAPQTAGVKQLQQLTSQPSATSFVGLQAGSTSSLPVASSVSSSAQIAFADVDAATAQQPIVATGNEPMPADVSTSGSLMSRLQAEIAKARAEKEGAPADASATTVAAAAKEAPLTPEALKKELEAYRRTLADSPSPIKPSTFKQANKDYMDGGAQTADGAQTAGSALLPPPDAASAGANGLLPPPELYAQNPKNLPIVPEPVTNKTVKVRTLADFSDADTGTTDANKVAIPENLRPRLAATDFPKLEILSFIPGQGVIAYANGREGVLMIGESLNGWELASVSADNAEFRAGRQSRTVTADSE